MSAKAAPLSTQLARTSACVSGAICSSGGAASTTPLPNRLIVSETDVHIASLHLPTKAMVRPSAVPRCSRIVIRSARVCTGWA